MKLGADQNLQTRCNPPARVTAQKGATCPLGFSGDLPAGFSAAACPLGLKGRETHCRGGSPAWGDLLKQDEQERTMEQQQEQERKKKEQQEQEQEKEQKQEQEQEEEEEEQQQQQHFFVARATRGMPLAGEEVGQVQAAVDSASWKRAP